MKNSGNYFNFTWNVFVAVCSHLWRPVSNYNRLINISFSLGKLTGINGSIACNLPKSCVPEKSKHAVSSFMLHLHRQSRSSHLCHVRRTSHIPSHNHSRYPCFFREGGTVVHSTQHELKDLGLLLEVGNKSHPKLHLRDTHPCPEGQLNCMLLSSWFHFQSCSIFHRSKHKT